MSHFQHLKLVLCSALSSSAGFCWCWRALFYLHNQTQSYLNLMLEGGILLCKLLLVPSCCLCSFFRGCCCPLCQLLLLQGILELLHQSSWYDSEG